MMDSYTIKSVKAVSGGYDINYGSGSIKVYTDECNFIPQNGQKIAIEKSGGRVTSLRINGRKIR